MAHSLKFHAPLKRVTVVAANGSPLSLNAEVEIVLKRPSKLDAKSNEAWDALSQDKAYSATVEDVLAGKGDA